MDFARFHIATFDCYGTLIDWETGILNALRPVLARHRVTVSDDALLEAYAMCESSLQRPPWKPYREILCNVVHAIGDQLGFRPASAEADALANSIGDWPAFADTAAALITLARRYSIIVLSNVDDDLFARTAPNLGAPLHDVVTAQQVRSYKPARAHFDEVRARTGRPARDILHIAQSLHHDIAPARALGFGTVWVNRRHGRNGSGATPPSAATPDLEVPDLATLAACVEESFSDE
ncbi:MAG: haloacid dehalogenase type II [Gemmatimonadetes bacterium]|nr:haloacid dehalogenase type II [Gemmatimonadota bacterium]